MTSANEGFSSRQSRILKNHPGPWGTSSQDFGRLAHLLFAESADYARSTDGNSSIFALAGIPMLFSALRCLLIELNSPIYAGQAKESVQEALAKRKSEVAVILENYTVPCALKRELEFLIEIRNEIIHPAHRPGPEQMGTPAYLNCLREAGLLQSTGGDSDYIWISQLQSHKLFRWAFATVKATVELLLVAHAVPSYVSDGLRESYSRFEQC